MSNKINVSEIFHSVQGEGNTMGKPSVFLRLQACNLMCGGQGTEKDQELHDGATWRCDTIETWLEGNGWKVDDLVEHLHMKYAKDFLQGSQLVITGGEPMLQQHLFYPLVSALEEELKKEIRVEVETNGTVDPEHVQDIVDQFNVSPKLSNSGMPKRRRIQEKPLEHLVKLCNENQAIFKFVATRQSDVQEIIDSYIQPFGMPAEKIWLMPGCFNQDQFKEVAPLVAKMCKDYGFHFSSRLQINLWNETTGV